ncbi:MAG: RHS repeat-associated core domain-containing protein [Bryobacteraceae bacterium]
MGDCSRRVYPRGAVNAYRSIVFDGGPPGINASDDEWDRGSGQTQRLSAVWGGDWVGTGGRGSAYATGAYPTTDTSVAPDQRMFTGEERDAETGIDYFEAIYFSSPQGRFTSPDLLVHPGDSEVGEAAFLSDPQRWNRYVYTRNNPLRYVDPDGYELKVAAELQRTVTTMRQQSPSFSAELAAHEGNGPNLTIKYGATPNDPGGQPSIGNTSGSISVVGIEPIPAPFEDSSSGVQYGGYRGATVTISSTIKGDQGQVEGTMAHEVGHVHDARTNTDDYGKQGQHTKETHGVTAHNARPEEKTANDFKAKVAAEREQTRKQQKEEKKRRRSVNYRPFFSCLPLLCTISLCFAQSSSAQKSGSQASEASLPKIAEELRSEFGPVRFERQGQLEDRYFVRGTSRAMLDLMPKVYQIQSTRFDEAGTERLPPNLPTMYIATSADGSRTFRLAGFDNAEESFNRLVKQGPVQQIIAKQDAESRGLLCAEIVYGLSPSWWLGGSLKAKLKAAEHFFSEGHEDGLLLAQKWWESTKGDREALEITTEKRNSAYRVRLPIFWAPVEGNSSMHVKAYRIGVSSAGTCTLTAPPDVVLR